MEFGYFSDQELPRFEHKDLDPALYKINSHGYRCPQFPIKSLEGGKNVVVLGCSHTFGIGSSVEELWVNMFEDKLSNPRLRFWNLGQPGASGDLMVRILYATEKILFPDIVLVCWPSTTRRERLDDPEPVNLTSSDEQLKLETDSTDRHNFMKNVFFIEKFAEHRNAKVFHCFAEDVQVVENAKAYVDETLKNCWPPFDKFNVADSERVIVNTPSTARDGLHYGPGHHERFAKQLHKAFYTKFK